MTSLAKKRLLTIGREFGGILAVFVSLQKVENAHRP
jgi:hypothetical protein